MKFLNMLLSDSMLPILFSEASDEDVGILVRVVVRYISGMPYDFRGRNDLKTVFSMSLKPVLDEWLSNKKSLVQKRRNIGRIGYDNKSVSDSEALFDEKTGNFDADLHQQTDRYNNSSKDEFRLKDKSSDEPLGEIVGDFETTVNNQTVSDNNRYVNDEYSKNTIKTADFDDNLRQQPERYNSSSKLEKTAKNEKNAENVADEKQETDDKTDRYNSSSKNDFWLKQNQGVFDKGGSQGSQNQKGSDVPSVRTDLVQNSDNYNNITSEESKSLDSVDTNTMKQLQDNPLQSADSYNPLLSADSTDLPKSNDNLSGSTALNPLQSDTDINLKVSVLPDGKSNSQVKSKISEETLANRWVTSISSRDVAEELWGTLSEAWNKLDSLRKARGLTEIRRSKINALLKKYSSDEILEGVKMVGQSDFLLGKKNMVVKDGKNIRGWAATVDWFLDHFDEIFEGKYTDTEQEKNGYHDLMKEWVKSGVVCKGA